MFCNKLYLVFGSIFISMTVFPFCLPVASNQLELVHVNLLWRHGARSPVYTFPTDPNAGYHWPQGIGQLTQQGMRLQYSLGKFFRNRYSSLLSEQYKQDEIYVRSTDVDRTLMSAECNLAGLYMPDSFQKWNKSHTNWQPIPVHTVPKNEDFVFLVPPRHHPEYFQMMKEIWILPAIVKIANQHKHFLEKVKNFTAWKGDVTLKNIFQVRDSLICAQTEGLPLAKWATREVVRVIAKLAGIELGTIFGFETKHREAIARIGSGALVKEIIDNMQRYINRSQPYKAMAYSVHDVTIAGLLVSLEAYMKAPIPFAASLMFELYKVKNSSNSEDSNYFVKTFYRPSSSQPLKQLKLLGCNLTCPLSELRERIAPIIPTRAKPIVPSPTDEATATLAVQFYIVSALLIATWSLIIAVLLHRKWKGKTENKVVYSPLARSPEEV